MLNLEVPIACVCNAVLYESLRICEQLCKCGPTPNAVIKRSVSVIVNQHCADSAYLCSVDFVYGSNIKINKF